MQDITYDFVILGGGSSGCVMAARLSEDPNVKVLLVEAGKDITPDNAPADVLASYPAKAYFNPDFTWPGLVANLGGTLGNRQAPRKLARYEQARLMGGGSSINGLIANRGAPTDYDSWTTFGGENWSWDAVLPYFRKLERDLDIDSEYHGKTGPIAIRRFPREDWSGFTSKVAKLMETRGFPALDDQNGKWEDGFMQATTSIDENERRVTTAIAYLSNQVRARANLTIAPETLVQSIMFEDGKAIGAELRTKSGPQTVRGKEIIVCSGTIHSPALLMRSGIGSESQLKALGIPVVANRPGVGANLLEHAAISVSCYLRPHARIKNLARHHTQAHLRFSSNLDDCPNGDMSLAVVARSAWHSIGQRIASLYFWVNNSYSRGTVTLRSGDVFDEPVVDFNMLSDPRDRQRLKQAFLFLADIAKSPELDSVRTKIFPTNFSDRIRKVSSPGAWNGFLMAIFSAMLDYLPFMRSFLVDTLVTEGVTMEKLLSDERALEQFLDSAVAGVWHPVGTCRMGQAGDPLAVTDGAGRVYGVENLRVCDASIMPTIPAANTNIPTIMVAERLADLIKGQRKA